MCVYTYIYDVLHRRYWVKYARNVMCGLSRDKKKKSNLLLISDSYFFF